ncbi:NifB/NifX family molybdenum-iron cluster-binding protein [Thermoanaerobacterium sp. RBIITD]|uniref:NifB/NifX family molybdenum-iron cluster-binding protein n=1 Tax=Thermoanaerobacterium sp. RBIITD TaxID=1550240 RepID=UPI000BB90D96|nr:NifB/NifX family molybdenum-iron cluster-binding protein [Thermoanaerobacterium sp. RBIITD]SNX55210.1 Predicted Fe-Mo cluster-binding protein, NifX family [Thermoanaerobacterium sp. RBIITD]
MKVAISSEGKTLESKVDSRFGRAQYFIIVDNQTMEYKVLDNTAASQSSGAGTKASQLLLDEKIEALISSNVGPNAMDVFNAADISVYKAVNGDVKTNLEDFNRGLLEKILEPTNRGHHGEH